MFTMVRNKWKIMIILPVKNEIGDDNIGIDFKDGRSNIGSSFVKPSELDSSIEEINNEKLHDKIINQLSVSQKKDFIFWVLTSTYSP